jgi:hypothetical protein
MAPEICQVLQFDINIVNNISLNVFQLRAHWASFADNGFRPYGRFLEVPSFLLNHGIIKLTLHQYLFPFESISGLVENNIEKMWY